MGKYIYTGAATLFFLFAPSEFNPSLAPSSLDGILTSQRNAQREISTNLANLQHAYRQLQSLDEMALFLDDESAKQERYKISASIASIYDGSQFPDYPNLRKDNFLVKSANNEISLMYSTINPRVDYILRIKLSQPDNASLVSMDGNGTISEPMLLKGK